MSDLIGRILGYNRLSSVQELRTSIRREMHEALWVCVMVYGLNIKPTQGYYVEVDALDGDLSKVEILDSTPDGGLPLNRSYVFSSGRAVVPDHMPTRMQWADRHGHSVPDFDNGLVLNVSEQARELIEEFDPGVHQFVPVDYYNQAGELLEKRYFLIVCNRLDSLDRDQTTMVLLRGMVWMPARDVDPSELPPGTDVSKPPEMVFSNAQIGDAHLWWDKHLRAGPFISDALADALEGAGMSGLKLSESRARAA